MRSKIALLIAGIAFLLAGCVVSSVSPFYDEKEVIFEPNLVGEWTNDHDPAETWKFAKEGEKRYAVRYTNSEKVTNDLEGCLFKLESHLLLDLFAKDKADNLTIIPAHILMKASLDGAALKLSTLDYEWLDKLLQKNPSALRHHRIRTGPGADDYRLVLTADTAELQAFLVKNFGTIQWTDLDPLKRMKSAN
jgi:hypothetical protein